MIREHYTGISGGVFWMPLDFVYGGFVVPGDYSSWDEGWLILGEDLDHEEWSGLEEDIRLNGLEDPVEIQVAHHLSGGPGMVILTNGHHRIAALRRIGWKKFPYKWFVCGRKPAFQSELLDVEKIIRPEFPAPPSGVAGVLRTERA